MSRVFPFGPTRTSLDRVIPGIVQTTGLAGLIAKCQRVINRLFGRRVIIETLQARAVGAEALQARAVAAESVQARATATEDIQGLLQAECGTE